MELVEKLKSIGKSIATFLGEQSTDENVKLDVADKLNDGTPVIFSPSLEMGSVVMATTDMGTMPLADGDYNLESGKSIVVFKGKVSEIGELKSDEAPALAELERVLSEKLSTKFDFSAKFETATKSINALEVKLVEQAKIMNDLLSAVVELSKTEPTREIQNPTPKGGFNPDAILDALEEIKKSKVKS